MMCHRTLEIAVKLFIELYLTQKVQCLETAGNSRQGLHVARSQNPGARREPMPAETPARSQRLHAHTPIRLSFASLRLCVRF